MRKLSSTLGALANLILGSTATIPSTATPGTLFIGTQGALIKGLVGGPDVVISGRSTDLATSYGPLRKIDAGTALITVGAAASKQARFRGYTQLPGASAAHPLPLTLGMGVDPHTITLTTGTSFDNAFVADAPVAYEIESDPTTGEFNVLVTWNTTGAKRVFIRVGGTVLSATITLPA